MAQMQCPRCGYASDDADFSISGGTAGTRDSKSSVLQTPQPSLPTGSGAVPLTVRGASSGNMGLANNGGRAINLARRLPVTTPMDLVVPRSEGGVTVVRHRRGGGTVGEMKHNNDGTWQSVVDGTDLTPHRQQRAALIEMVGAYNKTALSGQPLVPAPEQTPLMEQFGIPAIRLAYDPDSDGDNDDSTSGGDTDGDMAGGLNPRGKQIYSKLRGKGVAPKVAMAMAKRAQNKTAGGGFGQKAS